MGVKTFFRRFVLKYKLHKGFKQNKIVLINENDRGLGKTTMLVELSKKYDMPIYVEFKSVAHCLNQRFNTNNFKCCDDCNSLYGIRYPNGVLVDEGITMEKIKKLKEITNVRTGFYYNNILI